MKSPYSIHVNHGYDKNAYTYYPVLIVGAGESGIAAGCQLKQKLGFDQFRIVERQSGIGGTWWINRYPGVACDIATIFYSFSFAPFYTATSLFPSGKSMVKYLHDVASKYQIVDKIQCNVEVQEMRYLKDEELWEATLLHLAPGTGDMGAKQREQYIAKNGRQSVYLREEKVKAKIIISGVGGLVEPKEWPDHIPGRENFKGELFHTARWRDDVDLNGKDVVVVGTGCSAAQVVPGILEEPYNVKSVTQIMRSPPWVVPKPPEPFGKEKFAKNAPKIIGRIPGLGHTIRTLMFWISESDWFRIFGTKQFHENQRKGVEARLMKHMNRVVPEKYHEMMTPNYSLACKRRIFDADWFKSMNNERFHLTTQVLKRIEPDGITLAGAQTYPPGENKGAGEDVHLPADVIILANGFDLTQWLYPLRVYGDKGQSIHDVWDQRGGPQAYLGTAMDGFPNFFILFGPNTATGHSSVVFAIECAVMHTLKMIAPILRGDASTVEVKKEAEIKWTNDIQRQLKDTVFMSGGCTSWYYTANGWNATGYPRSQIDYWLRNKFPAYRDWNYSYTRKGLIKRRAKLALTYLIFTTLIVGSFWARRQGKSVVDVGRECVRTGLQFILTLLGKGVERAQELV